MSRSESLLGDADGVFDGCRWIRPLRSLPSTQPATSTTSPSVTSSHMETRRRNPNRPDNRVTIRPCRDINDGWNNVEVLDSFMFVCSVGIKVVLSLLLVLRVLQTGCKSVCKKKNKKTKKNSIYFFHVC